MCLERGCACTLKYADGIPLVSPCLKNILFLANFLTWLVGFTMIGVGVYAKVEKQYSHGLSELVVDPATPIIIFGCLVFLVTFFGCVGALRENICMLKFFSFVLVFALVVEVGCAFAAVILSDSYRESLGKLMYTSIEHYRDDPDVNDLVDWMQEEFKCCGVIEQKDWSYNEYFDCNINNPSLERCGVPYSCCKVDDDANITDVINTLCGIGLQNSEDSNLYIYDQGCLDSFLLWVHDHLFYISFFLVVLGCIPQILGVMISRILIIQINDQYRFIQLGLLVESGDIEYLGS